VKSPPGTEKKKPYIDGRYFGTGGLISPLGKMSPYNNLSSKTTAKKKRILSPTNQYPLRSKNQEKQISYK
jgi:hypothetical protein